MNNFNTFAIYVLLISMSKFALASEEVFKIESAVLKFIEKVEIPAESMGPIFEVKAQLGDLVNENDVLAQIDDREAQIKLDEAKVELEIIAAQAQSEVEIEFAEKSRKVVVADYERAAASNKRYSGVVSDREMDRLKLLIDQSDSELEKIKFEKSILKMQQSLKTSAVKKAQLVFDRHKIRSPLSGQIVEVQKRSGEWVDVAEPVFRIVRLDRLSVEDFLPQQIANSELTGAFATITVDGQTLNGKVVFVSPEVNPLNSNVLVRIEFENPKLELRPGSSGVVKITVERKASDRGRDQ